MTDETIEIEIDGKSLSAQPGQMLIEVADANDIRIPRFCYQISIENLFINTTDRAIS